jgi:acyl-CoA dehydrogenase
MEFEYSARCATLREKLLAFMDEHIYPNEHAYKQEVDNNGKEKGNRWLPTHIIEELKPLAREQGLWNLFLPKSVRAPEGLSNLDYAPLCEIMCRIPWAPEVFNCSAPDTGNMETIERYGSEEHKRQWLEPLLRGEIRSAFAMTEPDVASSDATNIGTRIERVGDEYVINGTKWWISGAGDPRCKIFILMGKTDPEAARHSQQSVRTPRNAFTSRDTATSGRSTRNRVSRRRVTGAGRLPTPPEHPIARKPRICVSGPRIRVNLRVWQVPRTRGSREQAARDGRCGVMTAFVVTQ